MESIVSKLSKFKSQTAIYAYLDTLSPEDCKRIVEHLDDTYYNGQSKVPDVVYDIIRDYSNERCKGLKKKVGHKVRDELQKCTLPYYMGSMDKIKGSDELDRWIMRNRAFTYLLTEKLDGVSCLLVSDSLGLTKIYSRGDGTTGVNMTVFLQSIKNIPSHIPPNTVCRGELLVSKEDFKKYEEQYSNPRNMVSGILNAKTLKDGIKDVQFVAYEFISNEPMRPSQQLEVLQYIGFKTIKSTEVQEIDMSSLSKTLTDMKRDSEFEIDGIVVYADNENIRSNDSNPSYAFAFKVNETGVKATVEGVSWEVSKHRYYKPTVNIKPVRVGGVTISSLTGFNALYIVQNGIGPGAEIRVVRSGDVIPYISEVIKHAPKVILPDSYKWNASNVDIMVPDDIYSDDAEKKRILHFFKTMEIPLLSDATISKFYDAGYTSIIAILNMKREDIERIEGFGSVSSSNIVKNLRSVKSAPLAKIMASSSTLGIGFGVKKCQKLVDSFPDILQKSLSKEDVCRIEGFSDKTALQFIANLEEFKRFYEDISTFIQADAEEPARKELRFEHVLSGKKVVFTGFRSSDMEGKIRDVGGEVVTGVSRKTDMVVASNPNDGSTKLSKARELGIRIISVKELEGMLSS
jgi:DNA ligase (NAD+)